MKNSRKYHKLSTFRRYVMRHHNAENAYRDSYGDIRVSHQFCVFVFQTLQEAIDFYMKG